MNDLSMRRWAATSGLALAAAAALWWLGSVRLALVHGSDAGRASAEALAALWLVRGMALAVLGVRIGASSGWRTGASAALAVVAPAWPVVVLAWSASTAPPLPVALAECALLAAGVALPWLGQGLRRTVRQAELATIVGTGLGVALAAGLWLARGLWALAPG